MITRENYSEEHIRNLQETSHRDPQLIERALYALCSMHILLRPTIYCLNTKNSRRLWCRVQQLE